MVLCEFWLILRSNAIVLMIGGVLKEMITILVGVTIFGDELNVINVSGILVVFLGVLLYKITHHMANSADKEIVAEDGDNGRFSRLSSGDLYEDEPSSLRRSKISKNSDPDLALKYSIDDDDSDDELPLRRIHLNAGRPMEIENPHVIT